MKSGYQTRSMGHAQGRGKVYVQVVVDVFCSFALDYRPGVGDGVEDQATGLLPVPPRVLRCGTP